MLKPAAKDVFLTARLLKRPAQHVARVVARRRLENVMQEAARLQAGGWKRAGGTDPEAVHDFRVALRRLRSWLRALRPALADTVRGGSRRRLRLLSEAAGRVRDLEVQQAALRAVMPTLHRAPADAAAWLAARLAADESVAVAALDALLVNELPETAARLEQELRRYSLEVDVDGRDAPPRAGGVLARLLREHVHAVGIALTRVKRPTQVRVAHRARIAVKRLRYLMDAFAPGSRATATAAERLGRLQDVLGELHDAHVLAERVALAAKQLRARHRASEPSAWSLGAVRSAFHKRAGDSFRKAPGAARGPAIAGAFGSIEQLARRLEAGRLGRADSQATSP